jgi:hypothetical protein
MRKLCLSACIVFVALGATPRCRAQLFSVYGTFSDLHLSNVPTGTSYGLAGAFTNNYASPNSPGVGGGVTLRLMRLGPLALGVDLRGSTKPGTPGADSALGGLKLSFKPPVGPLKFYVQGSGGYIESRTFNTTTYRQDPPGPISQPALNRYAAYEVLGGIDYHFVHFFDLRLVEFGGGKAIVPSTTDSVGKPSATLFTVNTGLVFHF